VLEALAAWRRFEGGEPQALNEVNLAMVVGALGGWPETIGTPWEAVMHFGIGSPADHRLVDQPWERRAALAVGEPRCQAAAGGPSNRPACYNPEVWRVYQPAVAAVVQALREEL